VNSGDAALAVNALISLGPGITICIFVSYTQQRKTSSYAMYAEGGLLFYGCTSFPGGPIVYTSLVIRLFVVLRKPLPTDKD
jgi:hypothetical protein